MKWNIMTLNFQLHYRKTWCHIREMQNYSLSESRGAQVCFVLDVCRRWPYWQQQQQRWPADVRTFLCLPSHRPPARGGIGEIGLTAVKCGILTQLANIEYLHCIPPPPCVHTVLDPSLTKISTKIQSFDVGEVTGTAHVVSCTGPLLVRWMCKVVWRGKVIMIKYATSISPDSLCPLFQRRNQRRSVCKIVIGNLTLT